MLIAPRNGRYLSTDSNKVDEPFKVEEAETIQVPPPPTEKVLSRCLGYEIASPSYSFAIFICELSFIFGLYAS